MSKKRLKRTYGGANVSIMDAFIEFISVKSVERLAEETLSNYTVSLSYFMRDMNLDGNAPIESIGKDEILGWIAKMEACGKKHTTINHYVGDLRAFAYWCMEDEREYITPSFKIKKVKGQEPGLKAYKKDAIEVLLEKPRKSDTFGEWRNWAMVNWVMATGNREATVCEVKIEDINFKEKKIVLRHTKNRQYQAIPLSTELASQLREYVNLWLRNASPDDYLFPSVSGGKLTTNALRHSYAKFCRKRGIEQTNFHGLRHSFADLSLENGRGAFELQTMLGHSTLEMTNKYIHYHKQTMEKDFDKHTPLDNLKKSTSRKRKIQRTI